MKKTRSKKSRDTVPLTKYVQYRAVTATFQDPCHGPRTEKPSDEGMKCLPLLDPPRVCRPPRISIFCLPKQIIIDLCKEIVNLPFLAFSIAYKIFTTKS
jgi:hypothetical protein